VVGCARVSANLVSAKLEGRSTVIAPPKNSVFVNAIFGSLVCFEVRIWREVCRSVLLSLHDVGWFICFMF
jgi:hypothetical protein